jgi:plastocyanin
LLIAAIASAPLKAGLYGIHIADPTGTTVFDRTIPVGQLGASTLVNNGTAQTASLTLTDQGYPARLSSVAAAVTSGSSALAALTAPGTVPNIVAPVGSLEVWKYAVAGAQPGVYTVSLTGAATGGAAAPSLYSSTQVVNPPASSATSFAFVATAPSAGTYNLVVTDFQYPSALQTLSSTVAQNGVALTADSSGNFTVTQAGPVVVVVNTTAATGGSGFFGVTVTTSGSSPVVLLDSTQAVGSHFVTSTFNVANAGSYDVTLADLGFPAAFQNLAVMVSRGSQIFGKIFAAGTFNISATPGQYNVTFIATPGSQNYGLYSLHVGSSVPTVTFTSSASSVTVGQTVTLTWSSQGATACVAGGGGSAWTANNGAPSGTASVTVSATETLTLTCTGPGGSATQSVTVTAVPVPPKSSSGGGGLDLTVLAMLGALRFWRRPRSGVTTPPDIQLT